MFACACALSLLLSLSLTRSHYIRDGKTFQTETSIQIIEKDDFVESKIIPRVCTHEVEAELGLAACPLEVPSTLSAAFLEDRPVDAERHQLNAPKLHLRVENAAAGIGSGPPGYPDHGMH